METYKVEFWIDLIPTPMKEVDVEFGMDWWSRNQAIVDCAGQMVRTQGPSGGELVMYGDREQTKKVSFSGAMRRRYLRRGFEFDSRRVSTSMRVIIQGDRILAYTERQRRWLDVVENYVGEILYHSGNVGGNGFAVIERVWFLQLRFGIGFGNLQGPGKKPKLSFLKIWGCEVYVKRTTSEKLKPKSDKCIFVGYPKNSMGYYFYSPNENKVFVARNGEFLEEKFLNQENTRNDIDLQIVEEDTPVPIVEPVTQQDNVETQPEMAEEVQTQDLRRSTRIRQEPDRYLGFLVSQDGGDLNEPTSYGEVVSGSESEQWQEAMKAEMQSMYDNQVWELTDLPQHCRAVGVNGFSRRKQTWTEMCTLLRIDWLQKVSRKLMASRSWNLHFDERLKEFGFAKSEFEPCVYTKFSGSIVTFLVLYVDDILLIGNDIPTLQSVKAWLSKCFQMKDLGEAAYILGIKIYRNRSRRLIGLSQGTYIDKVLKRFRMDEFKKGFIPMQHGIVLSKAQCPESKDKMKSIAYASTIGSIMYAMLCTRPDIAYSSYEQIPAQPRSQSGNVFTLNGGAILWKSSNQDTIADSTTEAEYIAASDATKEAVWLRNFITDLRVVASISRPVDIYYDNSGAVAQAKEPENITSRGMYLESFTSSERSLEEETQSRSESRKLEFKIEVLCSRRSSSGSRGGAVAVYSPLAFQKIEMEVEDETPTKQPTAEKDAKKKKDETIEVQPKVHQPRIPYP
ncbi:hypothetical protein OSB04_024421 [Centaurea solstitialis]|uniref:Reverse transcriptase Ty1/copia-type domain-containing protein n=1 Tax=Centaurea solstitialis TaxID=347529 RepID=A0AA38WC22_9ASTR|nr:hypothetical protein OSB04_024421 [Centaurea solstitialis]